MRPAMRPVYMSAYSLCAATWPNAPDAYPRVATGYYIYMSNTRSLSHCITGSMCMRFVDNTSRHPWSAAARNPRHCLQLVTGDATLPRLFSRAPVANSNSIESEEV